MRTYVVLAWLLLPILAGAYHFGPGQQRLQMDDAARLLVKAERSAQAESWSSAVGSYEAALPLIPGEQTYRRQRVRLGLAKARMLNHQLPMAHRELTSLMEELNDTHELPQTFINDARSALANSQYYLTWLMRLEGAPRPDWEKHIESARQNYKLIADSQQATKEEGIVSTAQHDLEAAIRLARMDLADLQGLPIPNQ